MIFNTHTQDKKAMDRALNEAKFMQTLNHFNIVSVLEYFTDTKAHVLRMIIEFADGGDLAMELKELQNEKKRGHSRTNSGLLKSTNSVATRLSEPQVLSYMVQLCLALRHVHMKHILHRDVKPSNIFLTKDGFVKLGDFGVAREQVYTAEPVWTQIGSIYWLSPEVCQDKPYNNASDMWSLGVVLYEMMTLRRPFEGTNQLAIANKICLAPPKALPKNYSMALRKLVLSLLHKQPEKRPSVRQVMQLPLMKQALTQYKLMRKKIRERDGKTAENARIQKSVRKQTAALAASSPKAKSSSPHRRSSSSSSSSSSSAAAASKRTPSARRARVPSVSSLQDLPEPDKVLGETTITIVNPLQEGNSSPSGGDEQDCDITVLRANSTFMSPQLQLDSDDDGEAATRVMGDFTRAAMGDEGNQNQEGNEREEDPEEPIAVCVQCKQACGDEDRVEIDSEGKSFEVTYYHARCFKCPECNTKIEDSGYVVDEQNRLRCFKCDVQQSKSWTCKQCTFSNPMENVCCEVCRTNRAWWPDNKSREFDGPLHDARASTSSSSSSSKAMEPWQCPLCTFHNPKYERCEMCGYSHLSVIDERRRQQMREVFAKYEKNHNRSQLQ
jgi:serine/threonine protein kinase